MRALTFVAFLGLIVWSPVEGQMNCGVNGGVPPTMRTEGSSELTGDILVTCTGGTPTPAGVTVPTVQIQVSLNTPVTSRILAGSFTEALLLVDDPGSPLNPVPQLVCGSPGTSETPAGSGICTGIRGTGTGTNVYTGTGARPNIFQGQLSASSLNVLTWPSVPLDPPGPTGTRTLRIVNVRTIPFAPFGGSGSADIIASVNLGSARLNGTPVVAFPVKGLLFSTRSADNTSVQSGAISVPACATGNAGIRVATLRFQENSGFAFRRRTAAPFTDTGTSPAPVNQNVPGGVPLTETGFFNANLLKDSLHGNVGAAGLADSGTRFRAAFSNIPAGITLYVDATNQGYNGPNAARLVTSESGSFSAAGANAGAIVPLSAVNGTATAVWEVLGADTDNAINTMDFGVYAGFSSSVGASTASITVNGNLAPVSTVVTPSATAPVPRFADLSTASPLFSVGNPNSCGTLTTSNGTLTFAGTSTIPPQTLRITASGATANITAFPYTVSGGNWLSVTPSSGANPAAFTIAVNPAGLANGTYQGNITVSAIGYSPQDVPVNLIVGSAPSISTSRSSLSFSASLGGTAAAQTFNIVNSGAALNYSVSVTTASGGNWLGATPASGTTPGTVSVSVNTAGLVAGTYQGAVIVSAGGSNTVTVPVSLTVTPGTGGTTLTVVPSSLTFSAVPGGSPPFQSLTVSSGGSPVAFTASASTTSGGNWLAVRPASGTTPGVIYVSIIPNSLAVGTYNGQISIAAPGSAPVLVPVTLNVIQGVTLLVSPSTLSPFSAAPGSSTPINQTISVANPGGGAANITAVAQSNAGWLSVTPASDTTPSRLTAVIQPGGLAAGTYEGIVTISSQGTTPYSMNISLNVVSSPTLIVPRLVSFTFNPSQPGLIPPPQKIPITSTDGSAINFRVSVSPISPRGVNWLTAVPSRNATPAYVTVSMDPAGLGSGSFLEVMTITPDTPSVAQGLLRASAVTPTNAHDSFVVASSTAPGPFMITPDPVSFSSPGANPDPSDISVANQGAVSFTATPQSIPQGWLTASPANGVTPARVRATVDTAGLPPSPDYLGSIAIQDLAGSPNGRVVGAHLAVGTGVSVSSESLQFTYQLGDPAPTPVNVTVSTGPAQAAFAAQVVNTSWLSATGGTPPSPMVVTVNPAGLNPGEYDGSILISSTGAANQAAVSVHLSVQPKAGNVSPSSNPVISQIVDGGAWKTTLLLTNPGTQANNINLRLWQDAGSAASIGFNGSAPAGQIPSTVMPSGLSVLESRSLPNDATTVAWSDVVSSGAVGGVALLRQHVEGRPDFEASIPLTLPVSSRLLLPFDNTSGFTTSIALANPGTAQVNVNVTVHDLSGGVTGAQASIPLGALGHTSFVAATLFPNTAGIRGVLEFTSQTSPISIAAFRFNDSGAFTTLNAIPDPTGTGSSPATLQTISQVVDGGAWKTTMLLTNVGSQPANYTLHFWQDATGTAFPLSINGGAASGQFSGTIAPNGLAFLETAGDPNVATAIAWADLTSNGSVGGVGVLRQRVSSRPDFEAAVPVVGAAQNRVLAPFDNTAGFTTSIAVANPASRPITVNLTIHDETGQVISTETPLSLPAEGHTSFIAPMSYPKTAGRRGVLEFSSPGNAISAIVLRFNDSGAFTSLNPIAGQ